MNKEKTNSFAYSKPDTNPQKIKQASQVSIDPEKPSKGDSLEYTQLSRMRFLRKDLDKD